MDSRQRLVQHCRRYIDRYQYSDYMEKYSNRLVEWIVKVINGSIIASNTDIVIKIREAELTSMIWGYNDDEGIRILRSILYDIIHYNDVNIESSNSPDEPSGKSYQPDEIPADRLISLLPSYNISLLKDSDGILIHNGSEYIGRLNDDYTIGRLKEEIPYRLTVLGGNARLSLSKRIKVNLDSELISVIRENVTNPNRFD